MNIVLCDYPLKMILEVLFHSLTEFILGAIPQQGDEFFMGLVLYPLALPEESCIIN
mgnify:CR=1 FL=1